MGSTSRSAIATMQRGYLAQPTPVATDIQAQLAEIGINITLDLQESGTFIDNSNAGSLPFFLLGWGADYPDADELLGLPLRCGRDAGVRHRVLRHPRATLRSRLDR